MKMTLREQTKPILKIFPASTNLAITAKRRTSVFGPGLSYLGSNHFQSSTDSNFEAFWPTDPILLVLKDLKSMSLVWEAGSIVTMGFALSK